MEKRVLLEIRSTQRFQQEDPEITKLVTEGWLSAHDGVIQLSYMETELTGLEGTKTSFTVEGDKVILLREGTVESRMCFAVGQEDRSLYDMGFGALMITVRTEKIETDLDENGGSVMVSYGIVIEDETAGNIQYLIHVQPIAEK